MQKLTYLALLLLISINVSSQNIENPKKGFSMNVLTYNTHHCSPPASGGIDIDGIAGVIISSKADVVLLQEIDKNVSRSGNTDQIKLLSEKTNLVYFQFFKAINLGEGEYGTAILSRYPISESFTHILKLNPGTEQRVMGSVVINLPKSEKMFIGSAHLDLDSNMRFLQVKQIDSIVMSKKMAVIFGGDFNASPESSEIRYLTNKYEQSAKTFSPTFPNVNPNKTIDYIFKNNYGTTEFISHTVISDVNASDHLPVLSKILVF